MELEESLNKCECEYSLTELYINDKPEDCSTSHVNMCGINSAEDITTTSGSDFGYEFDTSNDFSLEMCSDYDFDFSFE